MSESIAEAYSRTGAEWDAGPGPIYDRLSEELVARVPGGIAGEVLDLGAGTGAASRAASAAGAKRIVALDIAAGLLAVDAAARPPAVVGDARALPFRNGAFDAVVAAFSLNHVPDPAAALAEAARVLRPGGALAVSAYTTDDTHPVKEVVRAACAARGWVPPGWYHELQQEAMPKLATPERALAEASEVLPGAGADVVRVAFPELGRRALVAWRLGMAQLAPFVATLAPLERAALIDEAVAQVGDAPLVRSMVVLTWTKPPSTAS
jgi:ubiquinone/menaquinone biosynthesis C-methylase UbiE